MSILTQTKAEVTASLREHFTPARPIRSIEHLVGRQKFLDDAQNALLSAGRHLFIFGDRGVGKTSLAQTAALLINSAKTNPILLACNPDLNFFQLMADLLDNALSQVTKERAKTVEISLNLGPINAKLQQALQEDVNVEIKSVNSAVAILKYVAILGNGEQIVIIDEFDRMNPNQRRYLSDLIKQVSDQEVGVKFIFCGVATSLDDFVGFHNSVGRYVFSIHLDRIDMDSRKYIVSSAYEKLDVIIDSNMLTRIAQICDGYPYFVHLIGEQIILSMHRDAQNVLAQEDRIIPSIVSSKHFTDGIESSVASSEGFLKQQYEKAIMAGNNADCELALWAAADSPTLTRKVGDIYEASYIDLCSQFDRDPLPIEKFRTRMIALRNNHGEILRSIRPGWYQFSENMMRGYVRMRAIAAGATLSADHHLGSRRGQF